MSLLTENKAGIRPILAGTATGYLEAYHGEIRNGKPWHDAYATSEHLMTGLRPAMTLTHRKSIFAMAREQAVTEMERDSTQVTVTEQVAAAH